MESWRDGNELVARDIDGSVVRVGVHGWNQTASPPDSNDEPYDVWKGSAEALSLSGVNTAVFDTDGTRLGTHSNVTDSRTYSLPIDLRVDEEIQTRLFLEGETEQSLQIEPHNDGSRITSGDEIVCWIGFERPSDQPTIQIRQTLADLSEALSTFHRTTKATDPARTTVGKIRPAQVEWSETKHIPEALAWNETDPTVVYRCPRDLSEIAVGVPLVYYSGGVVDPASYISTTQLRLPDETYELTGLYRPQLVFKLIFYLDRLVRSCSPKDDTVREAQLLDNLGIDGRRLLDEPMHERIRTYLELDTSPREILDRLPEWHLALSVEPTLVNVHSILPLLEHAPVVNVAEHDGYIHEYGRIEKQNPYLPEVEPTSNTARTHGWIAPNVPSEGFKLLPEVFTLPEHLSTIEDPERDEIKICLISFSDVAADDGFDEVSTALRSYSDPENEYFIDVDHVKNPSASQLASLFESPIDLLHFIGHGDKMRGLECSDGYFSPEMVSESGVKTFFLNACESYEVAEGLIHKGSVAGVGMRDISLTDDCARVGSNWSRLMALGWPVITALELAETIHPKDVYYVLGDGTEILTQSDAGLPPTTEITPIDSTRYGITVTHDQPIRPLPAMSGTYAPDDEQWLAGSGRIYDLDKGQVESLLDDSLESPVFVEGELYWPDEREWLSHTSSGP